MKKRITKNDILLIGILLLAVLAICLFVRHIGGKEGARAVVTVDGKRYGSYPLSQDCSIPIEIDGRTANLFIISGGAADMTEADCPDKLCVHQKAIRKTNETIVCLPNKVVISIVGNEESELDSIAK